MAATRLECNLLTLELDLLLELVTPDPNIKRQRSLIVVSIPRSRQTRKLVKKTLLVKKSKSAAHSYRLKLLSMPTIYLFALSAMARKLTRKGKHVENVWVRERSI